MSLLRRRMMLQIKKKASKTLQNPDDFLIFNGGTNFYDQNFYIEVNSGKRQYTRRGIYGSVPTAKPCEYDGDFQHTPYPIEVPENCTKIKSVTWNVHGLQCIVFGAIWAGSNWSDRVAALNSGWQPSIENINLNGSTHFMLMFRVNDINTNFTDANTPTSVIVEFE